MQKEKQVRSYKRRTKSGKIITVRSHTAKYEAADKTGEISKRVLVRNSKNVKRNQYS